MSVLGPSETAWGLSSRTLNPYRYLREIVVSAIILEGFSAHPAAKKGRVSSVRVASRLLHQNSGHFRGFGRGPGEIFRDILVFFMDINFGNDFYMIS